MSARFIRSFAVLAALWALAFPGQLGAYAAAGTVTAPYVKLPMGARASGMGEAFTGIANDVNAIYYNPAGLAVLDAAQAEVMHLESFGGLRYENLSLAIPAEVLGADTWGTLGFAYTLLAVDDMFRTRVLPGTSDVYDFAYAGERNMFTAASSIYTLGYATQVTNVYSLGASFKAVQQRLDDWNSWALGADLGLVSRPEVVKGLSAGMSLMNLGSAGSGLALLPTQIRAGLGYNWDTPFTGLTKDTALQFGLDAVIPLAPVDGLTQLNLGAEFTRWIGDQAGMLRAGYRFPQPSLGTMAGFTLGSGLAVVLNGLNLNLDYAWIPYGELGSMQRLSLNAVFGFKAPVRTAAGSRLTPPVKISATPGNRSARLTWESSQRKVDGYNVYMTYNPSSGTWSKLNKTPLANPSVTVNSLYNGYKVYFAVSAMVKKSSTESQESDKSPPVMLVPGSTNPGVPLP